MGYSYDEIAQIFAEQGIKCKGSTLKKYHLQAKKKGINNSPIPELPEEKKFEETKSEHLTTKERKTRKETKSN